MKIRNKAVAPVTLVVRDIQHRHDWPCYQMYADWCRQFTILNVGGEYIPACIIPMSPSLFELCEIAEDYYVVDNQL